MALHPFFMGRGRDNRGWLQRWAIRIWIRILGLQDALRAAWLRARVGDAVVLTVEAEDEHGPAVHVAAGLVASNFGRDIAFWIHVAHSLAETAAAELLGAAEEIDGVVETVWSDAGFHRAEMLVT